jgi:hypothetical protein
VHRRADRRGGPAARRRSGTGISGRPDRRGPKRRRLSRRRHRHGGISRPVPLRHRGGRHMCLSLRAVPVHGRGPEGHSRRRGRGHARRSVQRRADRRHAGYGPRQYPARTRSLRSFLCRARHRHRHHQRLPSQFARAAGARRSRLLDPEGRGLRTLQRARYHLLRRPLPRSGRCAAGIRSSALRHAGDKRLPRDARIASSHAARVEDDEIPQQGGGR